MAFKEFGDSYPESIEMKNSGEFVVGTLKEIKHNVGINESTVYILEMLEPKKDVSIWGSKVLDDKISKAITEKRLVMNQSAIKITYLGKRKPKTGSKSYHDYKLEIDDGSGTVSEDSDNKTEATADNEEQKESM